MKYKVGIRSTGSKCSISVSIERRLIDIYLQLLDLYYIRAHNFPTALMQVALIAASCCAAPIYLVDGGNGCSCMLLHVVAFSCSDLH